jgi:hypothetical protein
MKTCTTLAAILALAGSAHATVFFFDLEGRGGSGLLPGNENHTVVGLDGGPGTGGEVGAGISYNDVSNVLTVNIGWGILNGFTSLTGAATAGHIHGPTTSGGAASFTQNAGVRYGLDSLVGWTANGAGGGFTGTVAINETDEAALYAGRFYINVHTSANGPGEIRGNLVLVPVPEPWETGAMMAGAVGVFALVRRLRATKA